MVVILTGSLMLLSSQLILFLAPCSVCLRESHAALVHPEMFIRRIYVSICLHHGCTFKSSQYSPAFASSPSFCLHSSGVPLHFAPAEALRFKDLVPNLISSARSLSNCHDSHDTWQSRSSSMVMEEQRAMLRLDTYGIALSYGGMGRPIVTSQHAEERLHTNCEL